jgi:hydroxymethylpyrimidine pyrophosphatase-like HAD family hydrolase
MYFSALATDYDDTLAQGGKVTQPTLDALERLRRSGRKLILVTGRELLELQEVFHKLDIFDLVVAENGAVLYTPASNETEVLADPVPPALVRRLRELNIQPLSIGHSIIATREPNEIAVLKAIRDLGIEQHIIFNKGAVMVLPINVNKSFGLQHALERLGLSPHNVVGIGDAENDQAFLGACGCAVAVGNALSSVKEKCDYVAASFQDGVIEMCDRLVEDDLASLAPLLPGHMPALGDGPDGETIRLDPRGTTLVAGGSQAGKTTLVTAVIEQMREAEFQYCIIDPEGDYHELPDAKVLGDSNHAPRISDAMELLENPSLSVVLNLLAVDLPDRSKFVVKFLAELQLLRDETGRPQWVILDEVHHYFNADQEASSTLPRAFPGVLAVTVHPNAIAPDFLQSVTAMVGLGEEAARALKEFCTATNREVTNRMPEGRGLLLQGNVVKPFQPRHPSVKQPPEPRRR